MTKKELPIIQKFSHLHIGVLSLAGILIAIGVAMLISAAQGEMDPWASRQLQRVALATPLMLTIALVDIRFWYRFGYATFLFGLLFLIAVDIKGYTGMGAQRWIRIGGMNFQPSELMKCFVVVGLAKYFHAVHPTHLKRLTTLIIPVILIALPALFILRQPNLGTTVIVAAVGGTVMFAAGVGWKKFVVVGIIALSLLPVAWSQLHDYQKQRVLTFLNPETDPLGAGYNILQSQIAIGSGGMTGKGYMQGSQGQLNFLPEKHTDFIFTMIAEEFGFLGGMGIILLYILLMGSCVHISIHSESDFGKLIAIGITAILFFHAFINIGMVMGVLPVVGVPLPLVSYGGSSMISTLIGFGFLLNIHIHREVKISR